MFAVPTNHTAFNENLPFLKERNGTEHLLEKLRLYMMLVVLYVSLIELTYELKIPSQVTLNAYKKTLFNNKSSVVGGFLGYTSTSCEFEASKRLSTLLQVPTSDNIKY